MKFEEKSPPRIFTVGQKNNIAIKDCGNILLEANEQVTFVTSSGKNHDFACKDWGFYSTPSVNARLKNEGFKVALVQNESGQVYIMSVDKDKIALFEEYCAKEKQTVLEWLDERPLKNNKD